MPVIINDFEIEVEPQEKPTRGAGGADEQPAGQQSAQPDPAVINSVVRLQRDRMERVRAD